MATKSKKATKSAKRGDAIAVLKDDHATMRKLLEALEKSQAKNPGRRTELLGKVATEVKIHAAVEEEIFYPAFKAAVKKKDDVKLYFEAIEEHGVVHTVLPEIEEMNPGTEKFSAKAKVLKDLIEHHAEEEEKEMFPRARKTMSKEALVDLGEQMRSRRAAYENNPASLEARTPASRLE